MAAPAARILVIEDNALLRAQLQRLVVALRVAQQLTRPKRLEADRAYAVLLRQR